MWSNNQWGTADFGANPISGYAPLLLVAQHSDTTGPTFELNTGETADIGFDFTLLLASAEVVSNASFSSDQTALALVSSTYSGPIAVARLSSATVLGDTATLSCSVTTSFGRVLSRKVYLVSRFSLATVATQPGNNYIPGAYGAGGLGEEPLGGTGASSSDGGYGVDGLGVNPLGL